MSLSGMYVEPGFAVKILHFFMTQVAMPGAHVDCPIPLCRMLGIHVAKPIFEMDEEL